MRKTLKFLIASGACLVMVGTGQMSAQAAMNLESYENARKKEKPKRGGSKHETIETNMDRRSTWDECMDDRLCGRGIGDSHTGRGCR